MNCVKCGNNLDAGARFCGGCGTQQPGAVVPQAAVKTGAKTLFAGSAPVIAKPANPNDLGLAQTIAPGSAQVPIVRPPAGSPSAPARPVTAPSPVAATPAPAADPSWEGDLTGKTLNNRYLIEGKLGEGGFGSVYRARQTQMNRQVALKVLHARMAKDPQVVGRFKREAQASSLLRAAHTVQVYDFDQTPEGVMYLSMEMLEGRSLHSALSEGPITPMRVVKILDGIAESLEEAHKQGIVHRDIKPENIFLEPRPTPDFVKVLDFGIAKIVSGDGMGSQPALTAAGQTLGTLEYMSPEQLMGKQLDGRSDLYALGILAYEMLIGSLPFPSKTPGEIITAHLKTVPPAPSTKAPEAGIPPLLDEIVLRLVQKNRDDRYKDTTELRGELAKLSGGQTASSAMPAVSTSQITAPLPQRTPSQQAEPVRASSGSGKLSPQIMMIAIGLAIGVAAVVLALLLKK